LNLENLIDQFGWKSSELAIVIKIVENFSFRKFILVATTRNHSARLELLIPLHHESAFPNSNFVT
jgi:hypothetical protein